MSVETVVNNSVTMSINVRGFQTGVDQVPFNNTRLLCFYRGEVVLWDQNWGGDLAMGC